MAAAPVGEGPLGCAAVDPVGEGPLDHVAATSVGEGPCPSPCAVHPSSAPNNRHSERSLQPAVLIPVGEGPCPSPYAMQQSASPNNRHSGRSAQRGAEESGRGKSMTRNTAALLCELNTRFYADNAASFSATRHSSWDGWDAALDVAGFASAPRRVVDVACGNMRFADCLAKRFPAAAIDYIGVDNCVPLASSVQRMQLAVSFAECDIVGCLIDDMPLELPVGDLVVCSGFMHHVPGQARRVRMLAELLRAVSPGGALVVSFWQFMGDERLARKASALTPLALEELGLSPGDLELGDYILGWQDSPTARRYCHSFTVEEVRSLADAALGETPCDCELSFLEADGRSGRLNCYLVARRLS